MDSLFRQILLPPIFFLALATSSLSSREYLAPIFLQPDLEKFAFWVEKDNRQLPYIVVE